MRHRRRNRGNQSNQQQPPVQGDLAADPAPPTEEQNVPVSPAPDLIAVPALPYDVETQSGASVSSPPPPLEAEAVPKHAAAVPEAPLSPPDPEPAVAQTWTPDPDPVVAEPVQVVPAAQPPRPEPEAQIAPQPEPEAQIAPQPQPQPQPQPEPAPSPIPEQATPAVATPGQRRAPTIAAEGQERRPDEVVIPRELPRVIAIANQKGGVGKTTTTVNLGAALAELEYRVLVIDLDPQGNATTGLGIDARNFELSMYDVIMRDQPLEDCIEPTSVKNLFVAPATIDLAGIEIELVPAFSRELKLKRAIDAVVNDFDFILIDCPPSLGLITVNGLAAAGEVLVPIQCEYYALEGLSQLLKNVKLVSSNLNETLDVSTIVLTMYDARTRLSVDVANEVRAHFASRVCRSVIPRTVRLSEAPSFGQPITVFDPTSRGAVAYRDLAKEVSHGATQRTR
jgi:chromosome partitioning protein